MNGYLHFFNNIYSLLNKSICLNVFLKIWSVKLYEMLCSLQSFLHQLNITYFYMLYRYAIYSILKFNLIVLKNFLKTLNYFICHLKLACYLNCILTSLSPYFSQIRLTDSGPPLRVSIAWHLPVASQSTLIFYSKIFFKIIICCIWLVFFNFLYWYFFLI